MMRADTESEKNVDEDEDSLTKTEEKNMKVKE